MSPVTNSDESDVEVPLRLRFLTVRADCRYLSSYNCSVSGPVSEGSAMGLRVSEKVLASVAVKVNSAVPVDELIIFPIWETGMNQT